MKLSLKQNAKMYRKIFIYFLLLLLCSLAPSSLKGQQLQRVFTFYRVDSLTPPPFYVHTEDQSISATVNSERNAYYQKVLKETPNFLKLFFTDIDTLGYAKVKGSQILECYVFYGLEVNTLDIMKLRLDGVYYDMQDTSFFYLKRENANNVNCNYYYGLPFYGDNLAPFENFKIHKGKGEFGCEELKMLPFEGYYQLTLGVKKGKLHYIKYTDSQGLIDTPVLLPRISIYYFLEE